MKNSTDLGFAETSHKTWPGGDDRLPRRSPSNNQPVPYAANQNEPTGVVRRSRHMGKTPLKKAKAQSSKAVRLETHHLV